MNCHFFVLSLLFITNVFQQPTINLDVIPKSISVGDTAILKWDVTNANHIFISHIGKVDPAGQIKISPEKSTKFLIIAEGIAGIQSKAVAVAVEGTRGDYAEISNFRYPMNIDLKIGLVTDACNLIQEVLQNQQFYSLDWRHVFGSGIYNIVTSNKFMPFLTDSTQTKIAARQTAYAVDISRNFENPNIFQFQIKTFIQYRRRIERTWRIETNEKFHHQASQKLIEDIETEYNKNN